MRRKEGNRALLHIVWNACSNVEFVKGAKRTTNLTWSQLCLFLAQLVCYRRYITCSELLSNEEGIIWTDHYVLVTWGSVDTWFTVVRFTPRFYKNQNVFCFLRG